MEQGAVYWVALRIILGMPLNAQRKTLCTCDTDGLDGPVFRDALDDHPPARLENALTMEAIDADCLLAEKARERAARNELHVVAVAVNDRGIGMNLAIL